MAWQIPQWTPDGERIITRLLALKGNARKASPTEPHSDHPSIATKTESAPTITVLRADTLWPYGGRQAVTETSVSATRALYAGDLAALDVTTGVTAILAHGYRPVAYRISSDGRFVAFSSLRGDNGMRTPDFDLFIVPFGTGYHGTPHTVTTRVVIDDWGKAMVWAPNSKTLLYVTVDASRGTRYYTVSAPDWQARQVVSHEHLNRTAGPSVFPPQGVQCASDGQVCYVLSTTALTVIGMRDGTVQTNVPAPTGYTMLALIGSPSRGVVHEYGGSSVAVIVRDDSTKAVGVARLRPRFATWTIQGKENLFYGTEHFLPMDLAADSQIVYVAEDAQHPPDVWTATVGFVHARQLTHIAPRLEHRPYGAARLVEWQTAAGMRVRAALLLPMDYSSGRRYPLVIYPYPREQRSDFLNRFGLTGTGVENMQLFATRGFAVLAPDMPLAMPCTMKDMAAMLLPAIDRMVALGIADSTRIGIMGQSWGGYAVLALLVQTHRFRSAVMRGGYGDLPALAGVMAPSGFASALVFAEAQCGGTLWEQEDCYVENSPIFALDRITTPLLIIHGELDTTVPAYLDNEVFVGLQRLGKRVEYARYARENHVESYWAARNQRDYLVRLVQWFSSQLQASWPVGRGTSKH